MISLYLPSARNSVFISISATPREYLRLCCGSPHFDDILTFQLFEAVIHDAFDLFKSFQVPKVRGVQHDL
jgi:hypothetical protein